MALMECGDQMDGAWSIGRRAHVTVKRVHAQHYPPTVNGNGNGNGGLEELAAGVEGLKVDGGQLEGEEDDDPGADGGVEEDEDGEDEGKGAWMDRCVSYLEVRYRLSLHSLLTPPPVLYTHTLFLSDPSR